MRAAVDLPVGFGNRWNLAADPMHAQQPCAGGPTHASQPLRMPLAAARSRNTAHRGSRTLSALEHHGCGELFEPKEAKRPLTIQIENAKIIGFVQILHGKLEMPAISLLRHREGHLIGDEFLDAFCLKFLDKRRIGERGNATLRLQAARFR